MTQVSNPIASFPIFQGLSDEDIGVLTRMMHPMDLEADDLLVRGGTPADAMFFVQEGEIIAEMLLQNGERIEVNRITRGGILGELGLVDGRPRTMDLRAARASRVLRLARADFEMMLDSLEPPAYRLLRAICAVACERLRFTDEAIDALYGVGGRDDNTALPGEETLGSRVKRLLGGLFKGAEQ
jgi:CRP-like cAMP-binding protein